MTQRSTTTETATIRPSIVAGRWRERIWGDSPEGAEHLVEHEGTVYLITTGTGERSGPYGFAYDVPEVAEWLDETAEQPAPEAEDGGWYGAFCDALSPVADADLARTVYRKTDPRIILIAAGACDEVVSEDELAASVHGWSAGARVEGGETSDDYDTGTVYYRSGALRVAWDSGVDTGVDATELRAEGARPIA